jgi:hypothetical protein
MANWMPSGLGAEPKKVVFLLVLLALAPLAYWYGNSSDTPVTPPSNPTRGGLPVVPDVVMPRAVNRAKAVRTTRGGTEDFRPTLNLPDDFDLSKVDPTLRTDLLAKVREVGEAGGSRSLFEFYTPPPPPPPKVDPIKPQPPKPVDTADVVPQQPPPAPVKVSPPIPLKYFGYEGAPRAGSKLRALFVDGEENFIVAENDVIRSRYRIVRIGTTSAEVEDTVSKSTQTIRIVDRSDP